MQDTPTLSVIILAGGHSSRMGRDKALLTFQNGMTLLARTVQVIQPLTSDVWVVTPWPERYRSRLPPDVQFVTETDFEPGDEDEDLSTGRLKLSAGPLSGFAQGWQQVSADWCLLLPCDMPNLDTSVLQDWWTWIVSQQSTDWPVIHSLVPMASLATGDEGWEPLCGFYHRRCIPSLNRQLEQGRRSFRSWLMKNRIAPYQSVPRQMLFNCNMPTDWSAVALDLERQGDDC